MITRIRKKLTLLYSVIFGVFLLGFIGIISAGIAWTTYLDRTEEIVSLARSIAREQRQALLEHRKKPIPAPTEMVVEDNYDISGQVFYYVFDPSRLLIKADVPVPILRQVIYGEILNWDPAQKTKLISVPLPAGTMATVIVAEQRVRSGDDIIGTVYVGRDVTAYTRVLMRGIIILSITATLFMALALYIGYYLAGRVIIPIEQSIERQKQFVADASHELRNPLSVLLTSIEGVQMDKNNVLSPFSKQILDDAKEEFSRLKRLVNDLLTLARMDAGDMGVKKETFNLDAVAEQVVRSLRVVAERKEVKIRLETEKPFEVYADAERLHQLLYILVENALKYSPANSDVQLRLEQAANGMKVIVADSGPGIRPEFQKQIFDRFFRVDETRSRAVEGSGLGLSIAQSIVNALQGKITVHSKPGKGTRFVVYIPNN